MSNLQSNHQSSKQNMNILFIPRVFTNITEKRIRSIFNELNIGEIDKIDLRNITTEKGEKFNRVYVHFRKWFDNETANSARNRLQEGKEIKIIYDNPWFWKVSAYRNIDPNQRRNINNGTNKNTNTNTNINTNSKRIIVKPMIKLDSDEETNNLIRTKHIPFPSLNDVLDSDFITPPPPPPDRKNQSHTKNIPGIKKVEKKIVFYSPISSIKEDIIQDSNEDIRCVNTSEK